MVKNAKVADLTLLVDAATAADGDYPIDVYSLGGGDIPQARQRLVLRVEANAGAFAAASLATHWPAALLDLALISLSADANAMTIEMAVEPSPLLARARALLGEGDIASARLLLLHLAEQGEGEAAYELARTFDRRVLAELGARGMDGDPTRAEGWYEQASESGNAEAKQRLKILASLGD
jgi:TPR repeat protein